MPASYTGNPTATQAPGGQPQGDAAPVGALPVDSDPPNAATFAQPLKEPLDWIAWLAKPTALASAWAQAIMRWRNSRGRTRFAVDHRGFPAGKIFHFTEDWSNVALTLKNSVGNGPWAGRWNYSIDGAGFSAVSVQPAGGASLSNRYPRTPALSMGTSAGGITASSCLAEYSVGGVGPVVLDADADLAMWWDDIIWTGLSPTGTEMSMGLAITSQLGVAGTFVAQSLPGAAFVRRGTDTNWQCYTKAFGGLQAFADSGVSAVDGVARRMRIEVMGANQGDNNVEHVIFYIDGVVVADILLDITGGSGATVFRPIPFFRSVATNIPTAHAIGVVDFRANLWPGDVVL